MKTIILLFFVFNCPYASCLAAFHQQAESKPQQSQEQVTETPEHAYAQRQFENAKELYEAARVQLKNKEKDYADDARSSFVEIRSNAARVLNDWTDKIKDANRNLNRAKLLLTTVDNCTVIYKSTAEKRVSDVLVKEQEGINACKAVGQFPPPTENKN